LVDEHIILYPLSLNVEGIGNVDEVVLVFKKEKSETLTMQGSISGSHLEAIQNNIEKILKIGNAEKIRESLLPIESSGKYLEGGWAYKTACGYFELSVSINGNEKTIISSLEVNNEYIWKNTILLSNHNFDNTVDII
jgi:hypothetical protein